MATQYKCASCGEWGLKRASCHHCSASRSVHSTFANYGKPERHKAFEMPHMKWNQDPQLPGWKRNALNAGRLANWIVLAVGGLFAWVAYWVAV